ncbi:zinc finger protein 300-like [Bradysia coprophila]|uniref:zinc finger protein 300-like n=1 Tax=Bradysia coprophila TaxID=38358 RepID=UPI00187D6EAE|nr:zinc finger protein 300-like [Bradysia coprophila]
MASILDILDSSVSPVYLLNHDVGQNISDALYANWNSDLSEEIARLELPSLVVPNLSALKCNNYNSVTKTKYLSDEFGGVAELNCPEHEAFPNIAFNNGEENMGSDLYYILDSSVSPVTLFNHDAGQNISDALYANWNSDISEEIARLELPSLVVPNVSALKYSNYNSVSSSSNINRMPPVKPSHCRLDRNAKNSVNESNASRSIAHTPKVQHFESYIVVALENIQREGVFLHRSTMTPVDSTEQSEDASHLDKCQGQLIGKNIKVPLESFAIGRPKQKKTHICTECNKHFDRADHLTRHLRIHFGEKRFECAECGVDFSKQSLLTLHERIHFDSRSFTCDICKKSFRRAECLRDHRNIHTGAKPYNCKLCNKTFARRSTLSVHRKSHKMC